MSYEISLHELHAQVVELHLHAGLGHVARIQLPGLRALKRTAKSSSNA